MGRLLLLFHQAAHAAGSLLPPSLLALLSSHLSPLMHSMQSVQLPPMPAPLLSLPSMLDSALTGFEPWEVLLLGALPLLLLFLLTSFMRSLLPDPPYLPALFSFLRSLPIVSGILRKEKAKMRASLLAARVQPPGPRFLQLPSEGLPADRVLATLRTLATEDVETTPGESKLSGAIYIGSEPHMRLLESAYSLFSLSNPLHSELWPSVRQMEAEVVSMTAAMLGGGPGSTVCGTMTSGGTDSILSAMKASRDYMRRYKGVRSPEMILAKSAHAAYWKACEYFKIRPVVVEVGPDFRLSAATVRRHLTRNTAVIIASAPGFPHGVVDHIADISRLAQRRGVCLHVDACLGGFVLPFARQLGYEVPPFDFSLPGVTSMSVDVHKFGMAHKGTSVVLYRSPELRREQYTGITDWTGGLYISPGMAGSRPGALIATAWSSMVHCGLQGYLDATRKMMEVAARFQSGLASFPELELVGKPEMTVVAFKAKNPKAFNIYQVNDALTKKGWHLNALQSPPALHFCFTAAHSTAVVDALLSDLGDAVQAVLRDPSSVTGSSAPMYGQTSSIPDRGMVAEFMATFQDVLLEP